MKKKIYVFSILFVLIDQLIKRVITIQIPYQSEQQIIPHFFSITNVHNEGGAWSILNGNVWFLILISVLALLFILYFLKKEETISKIEGLLYPLLLGGIVGNLIDRLFLGYVVDYLSFILFGYYFPVFNLADIGIVLSILGLLFLSMKEEYPWKKSK